MNDLYVAETSGMFVITDGSAQTGFLPNRFTIDTLVGKKVLRLYRPPEFAMQIELTGRYKHNPELYLKDKDNYYIQLETDYNPAISKYLEYKMFRYLKEYNLAAEAFQMYLAVLQKSRNQGPAPKTRMVYTR